MEYVYATMRSTHPECTAGIQSISETDTAATLAECHSEHTVMYASKVPQFTVLK